MHLQLVYMNSIPFSLWRISPITRDFLPKDTFNLFRCFGVSAWNVTDVNWRILLKTLASYEHLCKLVRLELGCCSWTFSLRSGFNELFDWITSIQDSAYRTWPECRLGDQMPYGG